MNPSASAFPSPPSVFRVFSVFRGALLTAFVLVLALSTAARAQLKVGDTFPALASSALTGGIVPETSGKILVVDFWASWCAPCKAAFPALGKINAEYSPRGLVLVGVSVDEKSAAYAAFVKKFAPPFPTFHDAQQKLVRAVVVPAMPTTYLIGRDGRIRHIHAGYHGDATDKLLRTQLDTLLAEK